MSFYFPRDTNLNELFSIAFLLHMHDPQNKLWVNYLVSIRLSLDLVIIPLFYESTIGLVLLLLYISSTINRFFFSRQKRRVHLSCVNEFCRQMCKWKEWINGGKFGRKLNQRKLIYPYKSLLWNMTALSLRRVISLCGTIFFVQRIIFVFTFGLFG